MRVWGAGIYSGWAISEFWPVEASLDIFNFVDVWELYSISLCICLCVRPCVKLISHLRCRQCTINQGESDPEYPF